MPPSIQGAFVPVFYGGCVRETLEVCRGLVGFTRSCTLAHSCHLQSRASGQLLVERALDRLEAQEAAALGGKG
ncbi:protein of unknown function [Pseudomonas mediterranea]